MAIVNVDLSEYDSLRNRKMELEEQNKELKQQVKDLKSGSKVIIRTVEESVVSDRPFHDFWGSDKPKRIISESYVGFEDVRLKVEEAMKADIASSIKSYEEKRKNYEENMGKVYEDRIQKLKEENKVLAESFNCHKKAFEKIEQLSESVLEDLNGRIFKASNAIRMVESISIVAKYRVALPYDKEDSGLRY